MKLSTVAIWAALPLTIIGLFASFLIAVAGAGHGDKSLIIYIFPFALFGFLLNSFVVGIVAVCLQFPIYAMLIYLASKRRWEWQVAGVLLLFHAGVVLWLVASG